MKSQSSPSWKKKKRRQLYLVLFSCFALNIKPPFITKRVAKRQALLPEYEGQGLINSPFHLELSSNDSEVC